MKLAGSALRMDAAIMNIVGIGKLTLRDAARTAAANPAAPKCSPWANAPTSLPLANLPLSKSKPSILRANDANKDSRGAGGPIAPGGSD